MALTPYCTPDEVRAVLGPSDVEIPDTTLNLPVFSLGLLRELRKVALSLPASFLTAEAAASPTTEQAELVAATSEFAVYCVARQAGVALGMSAPKDITDDKASIGRFSDSPYRDVLDRIEIMFQRTRANLVEVAGAQFAVSGTAGYLFPTGFLPSRRGIDPVTGA